MTKEIAGLSLPTYHDITDDDGGNMKRKFCD